MTLNVIGRNDPLFPNYGIGPVQVFQDVHPAFGKVMAKPGRLNLQGELVYPHRVVVGHRAVFVAEGKDPDYVRTLGTDEGATGFCRFLGEFPVHLQQKYCGNIIWYRHCGLSGPGQAAGIKIQCAGLRARAGG